MEAPKVNFSHDVDVGKVQTNSLESQAEQKSSWMGWMGRSVSKMLAPIFSPFTATKTSDDVGENVESSHSPLSSYIVKYALPENPKDIFSMDLARQGLLEIFKKTIKDHLLYNPTPIQVLLPSPLEAELLQEFQSDFSLFEAKAVQSIFLGPKVKEVIEDQLYRWYRYENGVIEVIPLNEDPATALIERSYPDGTKEEGFRLGMENWSGYRLFKDGLCRHHCPLLQDIFTNDRLWQVAMVHVDRKMEYRLVQADPNPLQKGYYIDSGLTSDEVEAKIALCDDMEFC